MQKGANSTLTEDPSAASLLLINNQLNDARNDNGLAKGYDNPLAYGFLIRFASVIEHINK